MTWFFFCPCNAYLSQYTIAGGEVICRIQIHNFILWWQSSFQRTIIILNLTLVVRRKCFMWSSLNIISLGSSNSLVIIIKIFQVPGNIKTSLSCFFLRFVLTINFPVEYEILAVGNTVAFISSLVQPLVNYQIPS